MSDYQILSTYALDAKTVKKRLIDLDMRPIDLVRKLRGISQQTVSRYINGEGRNPKIQQAIADALGIPLKKLFAKPQEPSRPSLSSSPTRQSGDESSALVASPQEHS
jgi:transcriptional regulator with XRE-family HTH domain